MSNIDQDKLFQLMADHLGVAVERITPETDLVEDLGADSLDTLDLVSAVNDEFEIELDLNQALEVQTVADFLAWVEKTGRD